jgi:hypothetical protein
MDYGRMNAVAARAGLAPELLRKARAFAASFTVRQLEELCRLCDRHGAAFGISHVLRLLAVPRERRAAFQREAVLGGWSKGRIDVEIRKRFGNRRPAAGRAWHVSRDVGEAYYRILVTCDQWPRLVRALSREGADGRGKTTLRADLPPDVRGFIRKAQAAIDRLQSTVTKKFKQVQREHS